MTNVKTCALPIFMSAEVMNKKKETTTITTFLECSSWDLHSQKWLDKISVYYERLLYTDVAKSLYQAQPDNSFVVIGQLALLRYTVTQRVLDLWESSVFSTGEARLRYPLPTLVCGQPHNYISAPQTAFNYIAPILIHRAIPEWSNIWLNVWNEA